MQEYNEHRLVSAGHRSMLVFNRMVIGLTKLGISLMGSRVLSVRGRKSGEWRSTPVNLLTLDGQRYLVAPRGHTQWVRNIRVNPEARLQLGRRTETFRAEELADADKPEILRLYLKKWAWEVGAFFGDDVKADSPTETLLHVAPGVPVFRIHPA
ncbi:deazaflavin-dependent oxidoreductase (nitroreductase family) [Kribbella sp. VKM Ac-2527]|uniref:Deazaflavin-dependent oxidoreductase (Nitroreductase family) n=1 Tax=Kribbella caucasensis TaxID=2512215 RepID=A0A4R6KS60_9ACTN|nr:nitroreductase family deazaflavin-dependent oxidoreductase [Kribbella sp. VKM Ac-2527]TDO55034.1 deazaflavin-dependent oxidoreductase (nitroreductase family) [Kribbella sp. VKM Ac-2527]